MFKNKMVMFGLLLSLGSVALVPAIDDDEIQPISEEVKKEDCFTKVSDFLTRDPRLVAYFVIYLGALASEVILEAQNSCKSSSSDSGEDNITPSFTSRIKAAVSTVGLRYRDFKGYKGNMLKLNSHYLAIKVGVGLPLLIELMRCVSKSNNIVTFEKI